MIPVPHIEIAQIGKPRAAGAVSFNANSFGAVLIWGSAASPATLWKDTAATQAAVADGDAVARMDNLSTAYTSAQCRFEQATAGREGVLRLGAAPNGGNTIQFDGVTDNLPLVNNVGGTHTAATHLIAFKASAMGFPYVPGGGSSGTRGSGSFFECNAGGASGADQVDCGHHWGDDRRATLAGCAAYNQWHIWTVVENAYCHNARFWRNGVEASSYANQTQNTALALELGAAAPSGYNGGIGGFVNLAGLAAMHVLEVVTWLGALTPAQVADAHSQVAAKWGIA